MHIDEILNLNKFNIEDYRNNKIPLVLYGAGEYCTTCLDLLSTYNIKPLAICDSNPQKIGMLFNNEYRVMTFEEVLKSHNNNFKVAISTVPLYYDEIKSYLLKFIPEEQILPVQFSNQFSIEKQASFLRQNIKVFELLCRNLNDEASLNVLENILKARISDDTKYYDKVYSGSQYFPEDIISLSQEEYFVDAGACTGDTIEMFIELVNNKYKKIYAFEPFEKIFSELESKKKNEFNSDSRISLYKSGLYSSNKKIGFNDSVTIGATRIDELYNDINCTDALMLDSIIDDKVTFIKMDIEGSELAALNGAKNTILKYKPKLAICVYHRFDDILTIPEYIMSLGIDYKYYLRHHGTAPNIHCETVFYAVRPGA